MLIKRTSSSFLLLILCCCGALSLKAQVVTDDLKLPDALRSHTGKEISSAEQWISARKLELHGLFQLHVYGQIPAEDLKVLFEVKHEDPEALNGIARSRSIEIHLEGNGQKHVIPMMLYLPKEGKGPYPTFIGLNFYGNHTIHSDPNIPISTSWARNNTEFCIFNNQADEVSRGVRSPRWPVERLIRRGYGLAVMYSGDIDPDYDDGFENGVHKLFGAKRDKESWGTISAWAWGLSRGMDYLAQHEDVDSEKVIVIGHSRLGKAALWAGASDERFAMVISNDSGCGGAALSRRKYGERLTDINKNFPHWFSDSFLQYNGKEEQLPVDQHQLISLIAPRPVYVGSAQQDEWADPYGEYLSLHFAAPVYELLGHPSPLSENQPAVNQVVHSGKLGYHMRSGKHDITRFDWERYMDFADLQFDRNK